MCKFTRHFFKFKSIACFSTNLNTCSKICFSINSTFTPNKKAVLNGNLNYKNHRICHFKLHY